MHPLLFLWDFLVLKEHTERPGQARAPDFRWMMLACLPTPTPCILLAPTLPTPPPPPDVLTLPPPSTGAVEQDLPQTALQAMPVFSSNPGAGVFHSLSSHANQTSQVVLQRGISVSPPKTTPEIHFAGC